MVDVGSTAYSFTRPEKKKKRKKSQQFRRLALPGPRVCMAVAFGQQPQWQNWAGAFGLYIL